MTELKWSYDNFVDYRINEYNSNKKKVIDIESQARIEDTFFARQEKVSFKGIFIENDHYEGFAFNSCLITDKILWGGFVINKDFRFNNSVFEKTFTLLGGTINTSSYFNGTFFAKEVWFDSVTFKGKVMFLDAIFCDKVKFINCIFEMIVSFENTVFACQIDFQNCIFQNIVDFRLTYSSQNDKSFYKILKGNINNSIFEEKVIFRDRHFDHIEFENTKFKKIVDFYNSKFLSALRFLNTAFEGTTFFSKTTFKEVVVFQYTQLSKNMVLREAEFQKGVNLSQINFIDQGCLNIFKVNISTFASISEKDSGDFDDGDNWKKISHSFKRETYRILKNESLKQNDRINGLEYHAHEMEAYREDLKTSVKWYNKDRIILAFNRFTNYYGLHWGLGLAVTLGIALFFYLVYYLSLDIHPVRFTMQTNLSDTWDCLGISSSYFAQFINPTHSISFMEKYVGNWSIFWDLISRIFIGLGIYQTIQAFRKFGRF